jgi:16S rRNA (cytosine1407-C5)-methyltransferase
MAKKHKKKQPAMTAAEYQAHSLARFLPLVDPSEQAALKAQLEQPLDSAVRFNPLKMDPKQVLQIMKERYAWEIRPVPFCEEAYWVHKADEQIGRTLEHRLGQFYIQDAASMLPVALFDFDEETPLILDLAASPGGKTTHLIARSMDKGLVIANDSSASRITALKLVLQTWGGTKAAVTRFPGEKFGSWFPEVFDKVLLDAPCSMQGLHSHESHPIRPITEKEQTQLSIRQTRLLESAIRAVKVGGQVVYSTCTLAPEEDEMVLQSVLELFGDSIRIESVSDKIGRPAPGLDAYQEQSFDSQIINSVRMWPHRFGTAGFFAALITKLRSTPGEVEAAPSRDLAAVEMFPIDKAQTAAIFAEQEARYGVQLRSLLTEQDLSLWQRYEQILAVPNRFLAHFANLPVQMLGLPFGEMTPNGLVPDFYWLSRFGYAYQWGWLDLSSESSKAWQSGQDIREFDETIGEPGQIILMRDAEARFLGCGRILKDRIRNLLPRRLMVDFR